MQGYLLFRKQTGETSVVFIAEQYIGEGQTLGSTGAVHYT